MARVLLTASALEDLSALSPTLRHRVELLFVRLRQWPAVSGAKPLRWALAGRWRLRTGDYRVQFRIDGTDVIVEKVGHRSDFYES